MSVSIRKLHDHFVGEVDGVDLTKPLSGDEVAALEAGMDEFAVLVFHDQHVTDEQQIAFSRNFGEIEQAVGSNVLKPAERRLTVDMADVGNLDQSGRIFERDDRRRMFNLGNLLWHSDSSFRVVPAKYSLLSGRAVPSKGGNTEFVDTRAVHDALDDETKTLIADLVCEHSLIYSRGKLGYEAFEEQERKAFAPVRHPLVRVHPVTGRKSVYLSSHIGTIVGWPMPEARLLIADLTEIATRPECIYSHQWRVGDLVMWDNRQTMHRARRFADTTEVRDMRRTTIAGEGPTMEQAA